MPTPTARLADRGSWRAKKRSGEPKFERGKPSCPSWLDKEAKAEWRRLAVQLDNAAVLAKSDRAALAALCDSWGDYVRAATELRAALAPGGMGYAAAISAGLVSAKAKAREALLKATDRFGLSPATRTRIKADEDGDQKPALSAFRIG